MQAENPSDSLDIAIVLVEGLIDRAINFIPDIIGALTVLIVGLWIAGRVRAIARKSFSRTEKIDETLGGFLSSLIYYAAVALVVITTLGVFGVPTTSFAAIIGAAGLAVGLALQGTLGHVASGVMMLAFRPFDVGDFVEAAGIAGTVKQIGLFTTEIATPDNKMIIVPNGKIFEDVITNYAGYDTRRVDFVFGVAYNTDLNHAMSVIQSEIDKLDTALKTPEPVIKVDNLGDSSVDIIARVWVMGPDYFPTKWTLTKAVKERFDEEVIGIPYPTRTVISEPVR